MDTDDLGFLSGFSSSSSHKVIQESDACTHVGLADVHCLVGDLLEVDTLGPSHDGRARHQHVGVGVLQAGSEGLCREAAENDCRLRGDRCEGKGDKS